MSFSTTSNDEKGINALSVDAGSLASMMSSIGVLEELMRRVQKVLGLTALPNPCDYFDLMAGAGFAGLLVIMLGRLRMSLDEAKLYCSGIVNKVFSEKKLFTIGESFKAAKLAAAVKRMLESCGAGADARMMDLRTVNRLGCKVMVCIASERAMKGAPVCLRTYAAERNSVPDCTIVEAVHATFALSGLFKPAVITESGGVKMSYVGLGGMNPTAQLLEEAVQIFPNVHVASVMSIGAGHKQIAAMDTDRTAQEMTVRFINTPGVYFRFNVEQGMRDIGLVDWEKLSDGIAHARTYLALAENEPRIKELAQAFSTKQKAIPLAHLNGAIPITSNTNHNLRECPPPSPLFVGRETQLGRVKRCLVNGSEERHVCVIHGLGGAGKTQLALKFAELYKKEYQHIFYVDATSTETTEADLKNIALAKHVSDRWSDALTWLARLRENWLVVYNNADDTSLNLRGYFPACSHGNILITTRNRRMINLAQGVDADCHILEMSDEDAERLLVKAARLTGEVGSPGLALIKELGCFALAIVQAGAYIHTRDCTVAEYLEMYRASKGQLLEEYAELVEKADDYGLTAYATWRVSYGQLRPLAKQLFDLLAFMHHDQITEDIFRYATIGLEGYAWTIPPTDDESATEQKTKSMLSNFTRLTDGSWDKAAFMQAIDDLQSYSLAAYERLNRTYSIHPLVHEWTRTMVMDGPATRSCTALLLAASVIWEFEAKDMAFRRTLVKHIDSLPRGEKMRPRLAERFEVVYRESGWQKDAEILNNTVVEANTKLHGRDHPHTLRSMANLAATYSSQGRWQEAEVLEREVLELTKRAGGAEHPDTLTSMSNLASTYWSQGRWKKAEVLEREVLDLSKRVRGVEHPDTLWCMANLASTYWSQGRWQEAEVLQQEVLELRKRVQGAEHPDTLTSVANLGSTYSSQGRWQEAEVLERQVLELRKRVRGAEHPETLTSMGNLALTYSRQGRWTEAEVLQREALDLKKRVIGSSHPDTLTSMHRLAVACCDLGRVREAEMLMQVAVDESKHMLDGAHPDTLSRLEYLDELQRRVRAEGTLVD